MVENSGKLHGITSLGIYAVGDSVLSHHVERVVFMSVWLLVTKELDCGLARFCFVKSTPMDIFRVDFQHTFMYTTWQFKLSMRIRCTDTQTETMNDRITNDDWGKMKNEKWTRAESRLKS